MTFRKINEGEVESDAGFKVKIGYSRLTYVEGSRATLLDAEHMADGTLVIYGPKAGGQGDPDERRRVIENVRRALAFLGGRFEITG
jgi:hypothetical protein